MPAWPPPHRSLETANRNHRAPPETAGFFFARRSRKGGVLIARRRRGPRKQAAKESFDVSPASQEIGDLKKRSDVVEGEVQGTKDVNTNQATAIQGVKQGLATEASRNDNQATLIQNLLDANQTKTDQIQALRADVNALIDALANRTNRIEALETFRNRNAGFAPAATNGTTNHSH